MKTILVTGATSGIGFALCSNLLEKGYRVLGIGRNPDQIIKLCNLYEQRFIFKQFDLSDCEGIEKLITDFCEEYGKLDGLALCAGIEETIPLNLYRPEKILNIFSVNVFSNIEILRIFSKKKNSNNNSSVVFLSSVMAELGQSGKIGYCASKSAILGVVKASALELVKRGIRVNAISPAVVSTPLTEKLFNGLPESAIQSIINMHPSGIGTVDDIVPMILFLLSDDAKWITGQNLKIDGGYSIS